jgi:membrane protein
MEQRDARCDVLLLNMRASIMASTHHFQSSPADERSRGRQANTPAEIPGRGWWDIAMRVRQEMAADNVSIIAAGLALYALLAVFPALAAAVSIYGLFASPAEMGQHLQQASAALPQDALRILQDQLNELAANPNNALSTGVIVGTLLALWSARKGMVALMTAMNVAYDEEEQRGFFKQLFLSLTFTIAAVVGFLAVLLLAVAVPLALSLLPLGPLSEILLLVVRWLLLFGVAIGGLAVLYRFAPSRRSAKWRWITPGSLIAAICWLLGSALFAVYVRNWGSYGETYGALGGVVVLLMWFYLSGYVVILGAEINSEMERQTVRDTTTGAEKPLGARSAYSADTVGSAAGTKKER